LLVRLPGELVLVRRIFLISALALVAASGVIVAIAVGNSASAGNADFVGSATPSPALSLPPIASSSPSMIPMQSPSPAATFPTLRAPTHPSSVTVHGATLFGWALLDTTTGKISGSSNDESTRNTVESMIKGWIAADFLRRKADDGKTPSKTQLNDIGLMIVDSNNQIAQEYYNIGGRDALIKRLVSICGLQNVKLKSGYWSYTEMSPADAVRYGECIRDGRAAGPTWTAWLLSVMKKVRGGVNAQVSDTKQGGRWGIIDGLPTSMKADLSMKNGWTKYKDGWHVNCLGIEPGWVLSVMIRTDTLPHAANDCAAVAKQLVVYH
jgi:hypothetical protein